LLPIPDEQRPQLENSYPAIIQLVDAYLAKEWFDSKRLQKGDLRSLIEGWATQVYAASKELGKTLPEGDPIRSQLMGYQNVDFQVEAMGGDEAELKLMVPGPEGSIQEIPVMLKNSDGRWLPRDLVDNWELAMEQASSAVATIRGDQVHQMVSSLLFVVNAPLNNLKNASTQEEFDRTLGELMQIAQGFAMSAAGGAAGGPPGGNPAGGFPPGGPPGGPNR
jgi:hypothetical protein